MQSLEGYSRLCAAIKSGVPLKKTHSIGELSHALVNLGMDPALTEDESDLLGSIYLPSKYPLGSVLPAFTPDAQTAHRCLAIADRVLTAAASLLAAG